jgi:hypothetical protein
LPEFNIVIITIYGNFLMQKSRNIETFQDDLGSILLLKVPLQQASMGLLGELPAEIVKDYVKG